MTRTAKEPVCFEGCRAKDGRIIRLMKKRYDDHILARHPEFTRDFNYPVSEIQKAIELADEIRIGADVPMQEYVGPAVKPDKNPGFGFSAKSRRVHVFVYCEKNNCGHVVTAYTVTIEPPRVVRVG